MSDDTEGLEQQSNIINFKQDNIGLIPGAFKSSEKITKNSFPGLPIDFLY
jgi:hypothetical protein